MVDISKAFNCVDHSLCIEDLYDMKCPSWLLNVIFSYLSNRSLVVSYLGATTEPSPMPGSAPQGTLLGVVIFLVKFNGALLRPKIPRDVFGPVREAKSISLKFMDDATTAVTVDLKSSLVQDPIQRPRPFTYIEQNQLVLPDDQNLLKYYLKDLIEFSEQNKLVINRGKTKIMTFNLSKKLQFPPKLGLPGQGFFEVVKSMKILGIIMSDNLKWQENTDNMCSKARKRLWIIRRLKNLKIDTATMIDIYKMEIRSLLEYACPVWNGAISKDEIEQIEKVQKSFIKILVDSNKIDYQQMCVSLNLEILQTRRENLCKKFISKEYVNNAGKFLIYPTDVNRQHRHTKLVKESQCRMSHFFNSCGP